MLLKFFFTQDTPNSYQVYNDHSYQVYNDLCKFIDSSDHNDQQTLVYISNISEDALAKIINKQYNSEPTLLHYAVKKEKIAVIEYLLDKGARYDIKNSSSETAYDYTKYFARADYIRNLMVGNSPIHQYAIQGNIEGIRRILDESALDFSIIDAKNRDGNTPLHLSVINQKTDTLQFLLDRGARIDQKNNEGNTPLQLACKKGDLQIVKYLIYRGADLTVIDREGNNLLHLLSRSGISDTAFFYSLVRNGVNPNLRNKLGDTPLHHLLRGDEPNQPAITSLINIGANINAIDRHGETPLLISLKKPQNGFYRLFLQAGANPNFFSSNLTSETPLERLVINLTAFYRRDNSNTQNFHNAVNRRISDFMGFGLKLTPEIKQKISSNGRIPEEIKTFINDQNPIQFDYDKCLEVNPKILEETTNSITRGNVVLDPTVPLTTSKVTSLDSFDKDMIGEVFVKSIKSISKEEWDSIKENPERLKILQDSGFATLIELSRIPDKDGEKFVDNDIAIKTAINLPEDFRKFYKLFVQIMLTNKSIVEGLLTPKSSKASEIIEHSSPSAIETSNPKEDSSKFDTTAPFSIPTLLLAFLSPEFKKELEVQDLMKGNLDKIAAEAGSIDPNSLVKEDSQLRLIASLAEIISSQIKNHSSSKAVNTTPQEASLGLAGSGFGGFSRGSSLSSKALGKRPDNESSAGGPSKRPNYSDEPQEASLGLAGSGFAGFSSCGSSLPSKAPRKRSDNESSAGGTLKKSRNYSGGPGEGGSSSRQR